MGTRTRVTTVAGAATLLCAAGVFGAGTSMAAPEPASAAAPQSLVSACGGTVQGAPGTPVGVRVAGLSVIHLGVVPDSGSTTFDASDILQDVMGPLAPACQVTAVALPDLLGGPVEAVAAPVLEAVGSLPVAPQQPDPGAPAAPPAAPAETPRAADAAAPAPAAAPVFGPLLPSFYPFALGSYHSGFLYNYSDLLADRVGGFGSLRAGSISSDLFATPAGTSPLAMADAATQDVVAAGSAATLPTSGADRVALPVLVAVGMLALVAAAVIRSWMVITRR